MKEDKFTTKKINIDFSKNKRLKEFYEWKNISQEEFASKIGTSQQYISAIVNNKRNVGSNLVNKIKSAFDDFNEYWFLTGEGLDLGDKEEKNDKKDEVFPVPEDDYMMVEFQDLETAGGKLGGGDIAALPEKKKRLVPKEYAKGFYLVVRVYGHSMDDNTKRSISEGEELLIKQYFDHIENLPIRSKLFVIVTDEGVVVKQIKKIDKEKRIILCHSFNPTWEDYEINIDEILQIFTVEKKVRSNIFF
ncbi:LexA family transcriptional regulator [Chryseobacterium potabilaquae]|uniref:HTH cro/C1-type domain-containing protein n=1 Tax=Chryseobacterium potabilaquae TaxID=2675057 RepID=A0A6N4XDZ3_9FLAO|nr:helix-turn-helix domain-containing protein [Chryseobacterium potabilaquae]CAA7196851.1 hypothetical protein CHRY9293_02916 [Chryseobacterium potabilaquae]